MSWENFLIRIRLLFNFGLIQYDYLSLLNEERLLNYIERQAHQLAQKENVPIFYMPFEKINEDVMVSNSGNAVGRFLYYKDKHGIPEIQIAIEHKSVWVLLHELGHYFIYKRDEIQTEENADLYIKEFFDTYLPPFFKWIFQIDMKVYCNKKLKFTDIECYKYKQEYKKFITASSEAGCS